MVLITRESASSLLGRKHDDRARLVRVDDLEVVDVDGVSRAADHACSVRSCPPCARISSSISTLSFSARMAMHARPRLSLAVTSSATTGEDLGRPAIDDRVPPLHDERPALAQLRQLVVYAGEYDPDQGAEDQDAAGRDRQHGEQVRPAPLIPAHVAGVYGPH